MSTFVPCTTPVKRAKVSNIETERLHRRRVFLTHGVLKTGALHPIDRRSEYGFRAAELFLIENELELRGETFYRRTNRIWSH